VRPQMYIENGSARATKYPWLGVTRPPTLPPT
jgi:hypothetical protein